MYNASDVPCLNLAIARLNKISPVHFAIWVTQAPYPGGYVHHDCLWTDALSQTWQAWQELFSVSDLPQLPLVPHATPAPDWPATGDSQSKRLMQDLGIQLWQWLFSGEIQNSLAQSQGIAIGKNSPLRLRLEIRDPSLIPLPWEIMQPQPGQPALSVREHMLWSRTTSDVAPLLPQNLGSLLRVLLVVGAGESLNLDREVATLTQAWQDSSRPQAVGNCLIPPVPCQVDTLVQPSPSQLLQTLSQGNYNIFFYAGHGVAAPDGGLLLLGPQSALNGTELAQVLVRHHVTVAIFNACWLAFPDQVGDQVIPRSSLAEVLLHHGVPAVLGMRDAIADHEALSFIQALAQALAQRLPLDQAVAVARQQLMTLYGFNQPAWTLPILYMHPEFTGELIKPIGEGVTELPNFSNAWADNSQAYLRDLGGTNQVWRIRGGLMRVGRRPENDLVIQERWVSQQHAEIICRGQEDGLSYFLRDFSRYGTLVYESGEWRKINHQEIQLQPGMHLKFGSSHGQTLEFTLSTTQ